MTNIEKQIREIYAAVYKKVFTKQNVAALLKGNKRKIKKTVQLLNESPDFQKFAAEFAKELSKKGLAQRKGIWKQYYKAAKSQHYVALPKTFTEFEAKIMTSAIKTNFKMIKTIPNEMIKLMEHKYVSTLIEEVAKGKLTRGTFERTLRKHGSTNARVIARTETAKLQTAILKGRATSLGSIAYTWLASNDKRTRPSHKEMNGVIVLWREQNEKPVLDKMQGDAGEFPNCRCSPQPIFYVDELTKPRYKIYNYKTHKIVELSKEEVSKILTSGSF